MRRIKPLFLEEKTLKTTRFTTDELKTRTWTQIIAAMDETFVLLTPRQLDILLTQDQGKATKIGRLTAFYGLNPVICITEDGYVAFTTRPNVLQEITEQGNVPQEITEQGWAMIVNAGIGIHSGTGKVVATLCHQTVAPKIAEAIKATTQAVLAAITADVKKIELIRLSHKLNPSVETTNYLFVDNALVKTGITNLLALNMVPTSASADIVDAIEAVELVENVEHTRTGHLVFQNNAFLMNWNPTTVTHGTAPSPAN